MKCVKALGNTNKCNLAFEACGAFACIAGKAALGDTRTSCMKRKEGVVLVLCIARFPHLFPEIVSE